MRNNKIRVSICFGLTAANTVQYEIFENIVRESDGEEGLVVSLRLNGNVQQADALRTFKEAILNSNIHWLGEQSGRWWIDIEKLSESVPAIKQMDWLSGTETPNVTIDYQLDPSDSREETVVLFKFNKETKILDEEFYRLATGLIQQKKEDLAYQQSEKWRKILNNEGANGFSFPSGSVYGKLDDLQLETIKKTGEIIWSSIQQTLETFNPPFHTQLAAELFLFAKSYFPVSLCEPKDYFKSSGQERPSAGTVMPHLAKWFGQTRLSSLERIRNEIDLNVIKRKQSNISRQANPIIEEKKKDKSFDYDVVISFAGENRNTVDPIATLAKEAGLSVFYDKFEEANLWGKNLYTHLSEVYNKKGKYCIIFISKEYKEKVWTTKEREAAQARALKETMEYILPIRLDDTELPGMEDTISYIDLRNPETTSKKIVHLLLQKLNRSLLNSHFTEIEIENFSLKERLAPFNGPPEYWEYTAYLSYCETLKNSSLIEKIKREMRTHHKVVDRYHQVQHGDNICEKAIPLIAASAKFLYLVGSNSNSLNEGRSDFSQTIELKIASHFRYMETIQGIVPIILPDCQYNVIPTELKNVSCFDLKGNVEKFGEKGFRIPIS